MTDDQIPRGRHDMWCPYWRKRMSTVCHTCPMWGSIKIENAQTGESVDRWSCSIALGPMVGMDIGRHARGIQHAVEDARNQTSKLLAESILRQERQHNEAMGTLTSPRLSRGHSEAPRLATSSGVSLNGNDVRQLDLLSGGEG